MTAPVHPVCYIRFAGTVYCTKYMFSPKPGLEKESRLIFYNKVHSVPAER